jgi:plastocyanin
MTERSRAPRESVLLPVLIPVGILVGIVTVLILFSRVLLRISHTAATVTALLVACSIMGFAVFVSNRDRVTGGSLVALGGGVLGFGMLAGGAALVLGAPEFRVAIAAPPEAASGGFSTNTLEAPSDVPFIIDFDNQDEGIEHNVVVVDETGTPISSVETIFGPAVAEYEVPPLQEGEYSFLCTIHPNTMTGTLTVAPGIGGPPVVVAEGIQFDTGTIELPADTESQIVFENRDAGIDHNIAIYPDDTATEALFRGEIFPGPAERTYEVPAISAGEYFFKCDVHPQMNGTVVVGGEGPGPPEPEGTGSPGG